MFWFFVSYINKPNYVCRKLSMHVKVSDTRYFDLLEYSKENT